MLFLAILLSQIASPDQIVEIIKNDLNQSMIYY